MSAPANLLLVEDDESGRELGAYNLRSAGYSVDTAVDGAEGIERFSAEHHDVVITDLRMPRVPGMEVLRHVKSVSPHTPVIVITAYGSVELAVQAMKLGAADYVGKPFNRDHLLLTVARVLETRSLQQEVSRLRAQVRGVERPLIADSDAMEVVLDLADRLAPTSTSVLLTGEPGTGRNLLARRIHMRSTAVAGPFVEIDATAIEPTRLEAILFGDEGRRGAASRAEHGTLHIRELTELSSTLQIRLLREIEARRDSAVPPWRLIASTSDDPDLAVASKRLRADLRHKLAAGEIRVPPLRERVDDIEPLARYFLRQHASGEPPELTDEFLAELTRRPWFGNALELSSACERAVALATGEGLSVSMLPPPRPGPDQAGFLDHWPPLPPEGIALFDLERRVIERVLELKKWNVTQTAVFLHVPRHILAYRMEKYGLRRAD